jgi:hypothetical protein
MKTHALPALLSASLLLGLAAPRALPARPPARVPTTEDLPFRCFTPAWYDSFEVVSARYERAGHRLVWVLQARKDTPVPACEASLTDGDGAEMAANKVRYDPARARVEAGSRLRAVVSLGNIAVRDVAKVLVRQRR